MNENKGARRLMMSAAVSLVILCLLGIGAVMGWWPPPPLASKKVVPLSPDERDGTALNTAADCDQCGVIESIRVETVLDKSSGNGTVAGAADESVDSDQETRERIRRHTNFRILVRMADGTHRTLYIKTRNFTVGQKVIVNRGHIVPHSNS